MEGGGRGVEVIYKGWFAGTLFIRVASSLVPVYTVLDLCRFGAYYLVPRPAAKH